MKKSKRPCRSIKLFCRLPKPRKPVRATFSAKNTATKFLYIILAILWKRLTQKNFAADLMLQTQVSSGGLLKSQKKRRWLPVSAELKRFWSNKKPARMFGRAAC